eukprot:Gb_06797 [translate_table: standard]
MDIGNLSCLPMALKIIIEIDILQIIANDGDGAQISPREITYIPIINIDDIITLDQILRVLAIHLVLIFLATIYKNEKVERVYGFNLLYKYLIQKKDGVSLDPFVLMNQEI